MNLYKNLATGAIFGAEGDVEKRILQNPHKYSPVKPAPEKSPEKDSGAKDATPKNGEDDKKESKDTIVRKPIKKPSGKSKKD